MQNTLQFFKYHQKFITDNSYLVEHWTFYFKTEIGFRDGH